MDLLRQVRQTLRRHQLLRPNSTAIVGVSGGPDSLCLLHLLHALAPEQDVHLHVAHLHHGLRGHEADADAAFVQETAAAWGLSCTVERAGVAGLAQQTGATLEEAARAARYTFLGRLARQLGAPVVAVGHNADDQAETVLMHFLRGSGLAGLRGMQPVSRFPLPQRQPPEPSLHLIRPLLFTSRSAILAYCQQHALEPRFDRSNEDTTFFRNRLRHELLPLLEGYNPQIRRILGHTAALLADDYELLAGDLLAAWPTALAEESEQRLVFDLGAWRALPTALQRGLLREAIQRLRASLRNVSYIHVDNAAWLLREGQAGDRMTLPAGLEIALSYDRFVVGGAGVELPIAGLPQLATESQPLALPGVTPLPPWQVECTVLTPAELPPHWQANGDRWQAWLDVDVLGPTPALRVGQPGDRFQPLGMAGHSKLLAELFTNAKIPAAARQRWPVLIAATGDIGWVCGLRIDQRAQVTTATQHILHLSLRRIKPQTSEAGGYVTVG
ncbi:MAG: tRNA lysidine(34) synthetase TilS [Anaerolineae bacterium]